MRKSFIAALVVGGLTATATAQTQLTATPAPAGQFAGTYHVLSGRFTPASTTTNFSGVCADELIYNQSAQSGFYFDPVSSGGTGITDEGIVPDASFGGNAATYSVNGLVVGYSTDHLLVDVTVDIWALGGDCFDAVTLGATTATVVATGLPGTSTPGTNETLLVALDLTGAEFLMSGSDGSTKFNYGLAYTGTGGTSVGPLLCGDPAACAEGAGTFADTGIGCDALGTGSGLGEADLFFFEPGIGCFFFGGYPANPFASFFLQVQGDLTGDTCDTALDIGSVVGAVPFDTTCNTTSGNGSCATINEDAFFAWTAPNNGDYTFDLCDGTATFDTRIGILSDCGTCIVQNDDFCGLQSSVTVSGLTAGDALIIQIGGFSAGNQGPGNLTITEFVDPCNGFPQDGLEDNDTCATATPVTTGYYPGLTIEVADGDYYTVNVPDLATLTAEIKFIDANGDTDIFLYDSLANCQLDEGLTTHGCANTLDCGFSVSDNETASWTNTTGGAVDVLIEVKMWEPDAGDCNDYDLVINVNAGGDVGTNYCNANANSSGVAAKMSASGSARLTNNDLVLECNNLPTALPFNTWNYFAVGTEQDYVILAVEQGNLCIGGSVGRFTGQINNAGMTGTSSAIVDLTALPGGLGAPLPGDTLYFTNYYRDRNPGPTSNLADGLCVTITP